MQLLVFACLAALAAAAPQHAPGYGRPYAYDYAVTDAYGAHAVKQEQSDGVNVQGQYSVQSETGTTHVSYGGYAKDLYKAPVHKAPAYKPAPVYKPEPAYHPAPVYKPEPAYHPAPYKAAPVY